MGYCATQTDSSFFIDGQNLPHVFNNIRALMAQAASQTNGRFGWVDTRAVLQAQSVKEQLQEWGFDADFDANRNLIGLYFTADKLSEELQLLQAIAPYVQPASYIEMTGEDGEKWRWYFDGSTCQEQTPEVRYPTAKGHTIDGEFHGVTTGRLSGTQPHQSNTPKSLKGPY